MSDLGFNTEAFEGGVQVPEMEVTPVSTEVPEVEAGKVTKNVIKVVETIVGAGIEVTDEFLAAHKEDEVSTSEFCRIVFTELNMSRREIANQFDINYRTVYGACINLKNDAPETHRGRTSTEATVCISPEGKVFAKKDGVNYLDGEVYEGSVDLVNFTTKNRKEFILEKIAEGMSNTDIAKLLQVSHGVIYNATKDMDGKPSNRDAMITLEDGTEVKRSEHIRKLHAEGMDRAAIAKQLNVAYNVVYAATKVEKSEAEKLAAAIEVVAKYADKVVDTETFNSAISLLQLAEIAEVVKDVEAPEVENTDEAAE